MAELATCLREGRTPDVVCISEEPHRAAEGALSLARAYCCAPIVLFRATEQTYLQRGWDLEIPPLTPPQEWLEQLARLLAITRVNVAASLDQREKSRVLREEAAATREQSRALRESVATLRERSGQ
ncbi:hypothetical protein DYQ86_06490 [Acidobacteria bacterium AB60]|nr:hypothetical protein DYQ86_06490 [Acidobacteria bacterium AB60]